MSTLKNEVAFIDANVADLDQLIAGLRSEVEPIVLTADRSATEQMARALDGVSGVAAVHVIAHGGEAEIRFAGGALSLGNLDRHAERLAEVRGALADDAVVQLFSCNVASGGSGQRFVDRLAETLGANVFASADKVGAEELCGTWDLLGSSRAGVMPVALPINAHTRGAWKHVLSAKFASFLLSQASDSGFSNSDGITSLTTLSFSGQLLASEYPGGFPTQVSIFLDADDDNFKDPGETSVTVTVDSGDGTFGGSLTFSENAAPYKVMAKVGSADYSDPVYVTVDTTPPSVTGLVLSSSAGPDQTYKAGDVVEVTATFSQAVYVTGSPLVQINIGGTLVSASYSSGSGSSQVVFAYTIQPGQTDANGISIAANSLVLNGGTIRDLAGNHAATAHVAVADNANHMVDTTAPNAPAITSISENANGSINAAEAADGTPVVVSLSGTNALAGDTLTVSWGGQTVAHTLTGSDITAISATVTIPAGTIGAQGDGTFNVTATVTDAAGNASNASTAWSVTVDTSSPNQPVISSFSDNSGLGSDTITNDTTPTLSITAEAGSTVEVFRDSVSVGFATQDSPGSYTFATSPPLGDGTYAFTAKATDAAGNVSTASTAQSITVDDTEPNAPAITSISENANGSINAAEAADGTPVVVSLSGTNALAGDTLTVSWGGQTVAHTLTGSDITAISATVTIPAGTIGAQGDGTFNVTATVTDAAGNASNASTAWSVTVDTSSPNQPVINSFSDNSGLGSDAITNDTTPTLSITAEAGSTVEVFRDSVSVGFATQDSPGSYTFATSPPLGDGTYAFTAKATDAAGNVSTASTTQSITVDSDADQNDDLTLTIGDISADINVANGQVTFEVTGLDGDSTGLVTFTDGSTPLTVVVGSNGTYSADLSLLASSTTISSSIVVTDTADNTAAANGNSVYTTIQAALNAAAPGATVRVAAGTYNENLLISKSVHLFATDGRSATTIAGVASGSELGTIHITPGTNNVEIGGIGAGFTVVGLNGDGAVEKAALYLQGGSTGHVFRGNDFVANGDEALLSEYGHAVSNLTIDSNVFSGKTFAGSQPGGIGFSTQFDPGNNVPRQLVVLGGGGSDGNTPASNITFTNNEIKGTTGGLSADDNSTPQGNTLVTIDAQGSLIQGNTFSGYTTGSGNALRARARDVDVVNNTIDHLTLGSDAKGMFINNYLNPGTYSGNSVVGHSGADVIYAMTPGADLVNGFGGDDVIYSDAGNDTLNGGAGDDVFIVAAASSLAGDTIDGGTHVNGDQIRFTSATTGETLVIGPGVTNVEEVRIATHNGATTGTTTLNLDASSAAAGLTLTGNDGANALIGSAFADSLSGNAGADILTGLAGNDTIDGGSGPDTAVFSGARSAYTITWNGTTAIVSGPDGTDTVTNVGKLSFAAGEDVFLVSAGGEYTTIQAGIHAADAGDTVLVAAGTYTENLTIAKSITLLGAQSGLAATGSARVGGESVINGAGTFAVTITADNVTIDGFEIANFGRDGVNVRTLEDAKPGDPSIGAFRTDVTITNNWIHSDLATTAQRNGIVVGEFSGDPARSDKIAEIDNLTIQGNYIDIESTGGRGLAFTSHFTNGASPMLTFRDTVIDSNTVVSGNNALFSGAPTDKFRFEAPSITGNTFDGTINSYNLFNATVSANTFTGLTLLGLENSTVSGNTFNSEGSYGLGLWGNEFGANVTNNVVVSGNTFNFNAVATTATYDAGIAYRIGVEADSIKLDGNTFTNGNSVLNLPAHDVIWRGSANADTLDAAVIKDILGNIVNVSLDLLGNAGDDILVGGILNDRLDGGANNDILKGNAGDDVLNGGAGIDTAVFSGNAADYSKVFGSLTVNDTNPVGGDDGADSLTNVEILDFADSNTYVVGNGSELSVEAAVLAADAGDTILIANGTYNLTSTLNIDKSLTIIGQTEGGVIINAGGSSYGILVTADGTSLSNFTLVGTAAQTYGLKGSADGLSGLDSRLEDLSISHVTVKGFGGSEFDLNGVLRATLSDVTANGLNTAGVGIAITDSTDVTLNNVVTLNNTWGSVALYSTNIFNNQQLTDIEFTGTYSHNEAVGIYAEDVSPMHDLGTVTFPPSYTSDGDGVWKVTNDAFRGGLGDSENFTFFFANKTDAVNFALGLQTLGNTRSVVEDPAGTLVVETGLTIQAAVDAADIGDTIKVGAGTFDENVNINKGVTILGAQDGVDGTALSRGVASGTGETNLIGEHVISTAGNVTIDGLRFINDGTTTGGGALTPTLKLLASATGNNTITNSIFYSTVVGGGIDDRAIASEVIGSGSITISGNYITGSAPNLFSTASWGRGIWFDGGGVALNVTGNTIEYSRTGMNLDMTGTSTANVSNNTFQNDGTALSLGVDSDGVNLLNNTFKNVGDEINIRSLPDAQTFDASATNSTVVTGFGGNDYFSILGGVGADNLTGTTGDDFIDGNNLTSAADNDIISGLAGNDILLGKGGNDTLSGGTGNDSISGGAGNDSIDGGDDIDTVIFSGNRADYSIALNDSTYTVIDNRVTTPDGTDTVTNVENFQFANGTFTAGGTLDVDLPTVTSVVYGTNDGTLKAGESVHLIVTFNEPITVVGLPFLGLNNGGTAALNAFTANSLTFTYTVGIGEDTADLAVTSLNLNGATIKDAQGNNADLSGAVNNNPTGTLVVDTIVAAPTINVVASNDVVNDGEALAGFAISGIGEAGATVTLSFDSSITLAGGNTAVVDGSGHWLVAVTDADVTAMGEGAESITATQTDVAGNTSAASAPKTITVDTVVAAPTINVVASNDVVNDGEALAGFAISGIGEVGATVTLSFDSSITLAGGNTAVVDGSGHWLVAVTDADVTAMGEGAESITATQADVAGNTSTPSGARIYSVDTVPPLVVLNAITQILDDSGTAGDFVTNDASVTVEGTFQGALAVGEAIQVSANGTDWVTATPIGNIWVAENVALEVGSGKLLTTRSIDMAGNFTLGPSQAYTLDNVALPPSLELANDTGDLDDDGITYDGLINVTGLEAGATWQYSINGGTTWLDGTDSTFTLADDTYVAGQIRVRQTDAQENTSATSSYADPITVDTVVATPTASLVVDTGSLPSDGITSDPALSFGTASEPVIRKFSLNGGVWETSYTAPTADGAYTLQVRDEDVAGNVAIGSVSFTLDTHVAAPTVTLSSDTGSSTNDGITNDASLTISTASEVVVREYRVNGGGWASTYTAPTANQSHVVEVRDTDVAGNWQIGSVNFSLDTVAPSEIINITQMVDDTETPGDFTTKDGSVTISGTFDGTLGSGEKIQVSANGSVWVDATPVGTVWAAASVSLVPGNGTLTIRTVDTAGNAATGATRSYVYIPVILGTPGQDTLAGTAADEELYGLGDNDTLNGGGGNDLLDGGSGADRLRGGTGDDTYIVDSQSDVVTEYVNEGMDTVNSSVSLVLTTNVENLTLTGTGAINGYGNAAANLLVGNGAANGLDGKAGADTMLGGLGNDSYTVDDAGDLVTEYAGQGTTDVVNAWISYTLPGFVERLFLKGTENINAYGHAGNNYLGGNSGNNTLDGGAGADTMAGGAGDDTYIVDSQGDRVNEVAGQGTDSVFSSVSLVLSGNVEDLTLTGNSAINGYGNASANTLTGNAGANFLDGKAGADTMSGGLGDDTYAVDDADDLAIENDGEGFDIVYSWLGTYTLPDFFERLVLQGTGNLNGSGNAANNNLIGNSGHNVLDGGEGVDTMAGGAGDDTYYVDHTADVVNESAGGGTDTIMSLVSRTLGSTVENLTLLGSSNITATGNSGSNLLTGNGGNNLLKGNDGADTLAGGLGNDTLTGGSGADRFVFDSAPGASNLDMITDLVSGTDVIELDMAVFQGFSLPGTPDAGLFLSGVGLTAAGDSDDRLIYNTSNGALYYDADGVGGDAAIQIATITGAPAVAHTDFYIV